MHWLLLVISVVFALAAAATAAVPKDVLEPATQPAAPGQNHRRPKSGQIADEGYKRCLNDWDVRAHDEKGMAGSARAGGWPTIAPSSGFTRDGDM